MSSTESSNPLVRIVRPGGAFGTGFIVHHDDHGTYIVTCRHVVFDGRQERPFSIEPLDPHDPKASFDADVIFPCPGDLPDPLDSIPDLAVLRCSASALGNRRPLRLGRALRTQRYKIVAYSRFLDDQGGIPRARYIQYNSILASDYSPSGPFRLENKAQLPIEPEHRGSPVIDDDEQVVIGVVTTVAPVAAHVERDGPAPIGVTPIEGLDLWRNRPPGVLAESRLWQIPSEPPVAGAVRAPAPRLFQMLAATW